ncbi:hypothetical protein SNEBB_003288 [Seison nebaliae]|nr:hypothetical protein SNEBB_003288 [Seison nebaliae]
MKFSDRIRLELESVQTFVSVLVGSSSKCLREQRDPSTINAPSIMKRTILVGTKYHQIYHREGEGNEPFFLDSIFNNRTSLYGVYFSVGISSLALLRCAYIYFPLIWKRIINSVHEYHFDDLAAQQINSRRRLLFEILKETFKNKSEPLKILEINPGDGSNLEFYPDDCDVIFYGNNPNEYSNDFFYYYHDVNMKRMIEKEEKIRLSQLPPEIPEIIINDEKSDYNQLNDKKSSFSLKLKILINFLNGRLILFDWIKWHQIHFPNLIIQSVNFIESIIEDFVNKYTNLQFQFPSINKYPEKDNVPIILSQTNNDMNDNSILSISSIDTQKNNSPVFVGYSNHNQNNLLEVNNWKDSFRNDEFFKFTLNSNFGPKLSASRRHRTRTMCEPFSTEHMSDPDILTMRKRVSSINERLNSKETTPNQSPAVSKQTSIRQPRPLTKSVSDTKTITVKQLMQLKEKRMVSINNLMEDQIIDDSSTYYQQKKNEHIRGYRTQLSELSCKLNDEILNEEFEDDKQKSFPKKDEDNDYFYTSDDDDRLVQLKLSNNHFDDDRSVEEDNLEDEEDPFKNYSIHISELLYGHVSDISKLESISQDVVISTLSLCRFPEPHWPLQEIFRILKPGGLFLYLEHIRANDSSIWLKVQRLLQPIWSILFNNCNLLNHVSPEIFRRFDRRHIARHFSFSDAETFRQIHEFNQRSFNLRRFIYRFPSLFFDVIFNYPIEFFQNFFQSSTTTISSSTTDECDQDVDFNTTVDQNSLFRIGRQRTNTEWQPKSSIKIIHHQHFSLSSLPFYLSFLRPHAVGVIQKQ